MSHPYNLCELRIYKAAESRRNGVVGRTGRKMPIIPSANDTLPMIAKRYLIIMYLRREGTKNIQQRETMTTAAYIFL